MAASRSTRAAPAAASAAATCGSSWSRTARPAGSRKCAWRNWFTPLRVQRSQACCGVSGGGALSRSDDGDLVAVGGEQHPGRQPAHPGAQHDDLRHW
ncbi:MAG: hypothetical protein JO132_11225 [Streptosporangiaceae bacterium]|nr:hypothetical protein [Streptosporangiaceae bacterium]